MAAHASIWIEDLDRAARILDRVLGAARDASAVSALIHPLAVQRAPRPPARPLGGGAGRRRRSRSSSPRTPASSPLLAHALAALTLVEAGLRPRGRLPAPRRRAGSRWSRAPGDATGAYLHAALGLLELGLGPDPGGDRGARETAAHRATRRGMQLGGGAAARPTWSRPTCAPAAATRREALIDVLRGARPQDRLALGRRPPSAALRALLAPDDEMRGAVRGRARAPRRAADAVRARPHAARASASGCGAPSSAPRRASR